jgi:hypothetical protein
VGTLHTMTVPALTARGFWMRVVVFSASLLAYAWAAAIMLRERFLFGLGFFLPVVLLSLIRLVVIVVHRPPGRPR